MSLFEQLKRNRSVADYKEPAAAKATELFFWLKTDAQGVYIDATDKNGKEVSFDYRQYSGMIRSIARSIQLINDRNNFTID